MDRELLFCVADVLSADAVFAGRPYADVTLVLLVFDCRGSRQKCLGKMHVNAVIAGYGCEGDDLERGGGQGAEAEFMLKWHGLAPLDFVADCVDPWCLYDRSFLARLEVANQATLRQVPIVETMRLAETCPGRRKVRRVMVEHGIARSRYEDLRNLKCLGEWQVDVYWGDFEDRHPVRWWVLQDILRKPPALLIDTKYGQAAVSSSTRCAVRHLRQVLRPGKGGRVDFAGRDKHLLTLLAIALNSRHVLNRDAATLFPDSDKVIAEPKSGADACRKRIAALRRWLEPDPDEFVLGGTKGFEGAHAGTPNPKCTFIVVADPLLERIAKQEGTFEKWKAARRDVAVE